MKWLLYALAGVGGLLVICFIMLLFLGGLRGESRLVASIDIAKAPSTVFTWLSRPEKLKSWVGWLVEVQDLTPNQTGVGARQVWVMEDRNNNNQRMDIASEITRYDQDRVLESRVSAAAGFTGEVRYELDCGALASALRQLADALENCRAVCCAQSEEMTDECCGPRC